MQRAARAKKPSKSAAALAALQAARAGVKTNHDSDVEMSGDEVARDDDAGDRAEPAAEAGGNVGKRRQAGAALRLSIPRHIAFVMTFSTAVTG